MHTRCCAGHRPATSWVHYTTSCNTQSSAPEDGQNNCPKHVELTGIINEPLLLHLVGCLYYLYQWCTVKQISENEIYLLIKYLKSVLWRVAKRLSYIQEARRLKVEGACETRKMQYTLHTLTWVAVMSHYSCCAVSTTFWQGLQTLFNTVITKCQASLRVEGGYFWCQL